jgi:hypothetical protein
MFYGQHSYYPECKILKCSEMKTVLCPSSGPVGKDASCVFDISEDDLFKQNNTRATTQKLQAANKLLKSAEAFCEIAMVLLIENDEKECITCRAVAKRGERLTHTKCIVFEIQEHLKGVVK